MNDYGPLAGLVASVGALLSAGGAITLAWMRTSNWTPPEDDVPSGPSKVASLLTASAVAGMWFETGKSLTSRDLQQISAVAGGLMVVALILYTFMMGVFVYERQVAQPDGRSVDTKKTIGGFWLLPAAKKGLHNAQTVQRLFAGAAYDPDLLWSRLSRSLVKIIFILSFITLLVSGSVAISSIALSIDPSAFYSPLAGIRSRGTPKSESRRTALHDQSLGKKSSQTPKLSPTPTSKASSPR